MARVRSGAVTKARHKKVLKQAKGYFGSKHRLYKTAKEQLMHSGQYAYRDRKNRKRDFRKLWITRINAACRQNDISYSRFIEGLTKAGVEVNRKMLSEIAINDPKAFTELVDISKKGRAGKLKPAEEVTGSEVTVGKTKKEVVKKEIKKDIAEKKAKVKKDIEEKKEDVKEKKAKVKKNIEDKKENVKADVKKAKEKIEKRIDYSKMTVAELKEEAAKKDIKVSGLKKAEIIKELEK